jgi:hypothetical protein
MGANATQGLAILLFLVAFTFLGGALYTGGNILLFLLFVVAFAASVGTFLKCKPWEEGR